ncbi:hypothetical protein PCAR4_250016 [Paraburkholderia caribensis]|nr:hypothetical protein PCAR4_250016 [Paraburkholderia caribensis]
MCPRPRIGWARVDQPHGGDVNIPIPPVDTNDRSGASLVVAAVRAYKSRTGVRGRPLDTSTAMPR